MSLRAMMRPSRWRSASSSSARRNTPQAFAPAVVVAEVVEPGRCTRGRRAATSSSSAHERGRRSELAPERVELLDPLRTRLRRPDHASDVAREHGGAPARQLLAPRRSASTTGCARGKVRADVGERHDAAPRAPGANACRSSGTRACPRAGPRCRSSWERRDRRPRRRGAPARRRRRTPASCSGSSGGSRSRRSRAGTGGARSSPSSRRRGVGRDDERLVRVRAPTIPRRTRSSGAPPFGVRRRRRPRCAAASPAPARRSAPELDRPLDPGRGAVERGGEARARSAAAGGTPRVSTRSIVSVATRSCSQSHRYWRTRNMRASGCDCDPVAVVAVGRDPELERAVGRDVEIGERLLARTRRNGRGACRRRRARTARRARRDVARRRGTSRPGSIAARV